MANWISSGDSLRLICWISCPSCAALFAGLCEFGVSLLEDFLVFSGEFVCGRDVADGDVEPDFVVVMHIVSDEAAGIVERQGRASGQPHVVFLLQHPQQIVSVQRTFVSFVLQTQLGWVGFEFIHRDSS